jgi:hypothetical protein
MPVLCDCETSCFAWKEGHRLERLIKYWYLIGMKYAAVVYNVMMKVVGYANAVVGYYGPNVKLTHGQTYVAETTSKGEKGVG